MAGMNLRGTEPAIVISSLQGRKALEVPEEVPWPRMAEAISNRWKLWNEVGLTQDHLLYLANKIFPGK